MKCQQPSEGFFSLQKYVIMSQRITAGCQLCSAWIQTEIVERELPLPVKMAQEMVKEKYQEIPMQTSSPLEHRTA